MSWSEQLWDLSNWSNKELKNNRHTYKNIGIRGAMLSDGNGAATAPKPSIYYIHHGAVRSRLVSTCKGSLWEQSQAAVIQKEESLVDTFCTHCQHIYSDQGKTLTVFLPWPSAGPTMMLQHLGLWHGCDHVNSTRSLKLHLFYTNGIFRMAAMFRSPCEKAEPTFCYFLKLLKKKSLLALSFFSLFASYNL